MQPSFQPANLPASVTSFYDYFTGEANVRSVASAFGYSFVREYMTLPQSDVAPDWEPALRQQIIKRLPKISMGNESARRETLIAPVLLEIVEHMDVYLLIEQWINVAPQLKGRLDYVVEAKQSLLVVEAKDGNTFNGTTQLVAEMIALDKWSTTGDRLLYGAITTGDLWYFAAMERETKAITVDVRGYSVPGELDKLVRILIGILESEPTNNATI